MCVCVWGWEGGEYLIDGSGWCSVAGASAAYGGSWLWEVLCACVERGVCV